MICLSSIDSLYEHVYRIGLNSSMRPSLILIGGCSRSGKSTVTLTLSERLTNDRVENHIVKIDSWLISLEKRTSGSTVLGRYDCEAIVKSIKEILNGNIIYPPIYDVYSRRRIAEYDKIPIFAKTGIVFLEGTIALALRELLEVASLKVFVNISEKIRLQRLNDFYNKTKGLSPTETTKIIYSREIEEVPFIKTTAEYADVIFEI